ncbi:hypothetical protein FRB90_003945, partial [Tulasnella sp. 427]
MLKHRPDDQSLDLAQTPARKKPRLSDETDLRRPFTNVKSRSASLNIYSQSSPDAKARRQKAIEMALKGLNDSDATGSEKPAGPQVPETPLGRASPPPEVIPSSQDSEMSHPDDVTEPAPALSTSGPSNDATRSPLLDPHLNTSTSALDDEDPTEASNGALELSSWFEPSASQASFLPASQLPEISKSIKVHKPTTWVMPSQSALDIAARRVEQWQQEPEANEERQEPSATPARKPLGTIGNLGANPPGSSGSPILKLGGRQPFKPPLRVGGDMSNPFASQAPRPRVSNFSNPVFQSSPLNPNAIGQRAAAGHPSPSLTFNTPARGGL